MNAKEFRKNVTVRDHVFHFEEAGEDAYLRAFKDGNVYADVLEKPDVLVNPACAKKIAWLNSQPSSKLRFRDFAGLKTYGRDKVSGMKWEALKDLLPADQLEKLTVQIGQERTLQVLRWVKRGLNPDHAVHKVRVDMEIAQNAQ